MQTECSHPKRVRFSAAPDVNSPFVTKWWCPECDDVLEPKE